MLTITNLTKSFEAISAVTDVSFSINSGEIVTLIGPNSAGKSTIVKCIVGLLAPNKGRITVDDYDVVKDPIKAKASIGYIPDEPSVWPYMTGAEFIAFTKALFREHVTIPCTPLMELMKIFSLEGLEHRRFEDYSRGNKQKWSILAALSHHPKLLVVDEPIVGLDPLGADIAKKLFVEHAKKGGSVLLVTHTLSVAEQVSDRIGFLKEGSLIAYGTLSELRAQAGLDKGASLEEVYRALAA